MYIIYRAVPSAQRRFFFVDIAGVATPNGSFLSVPGKCSPGAGR